MLQFSEVKTVFGDKKLRPHIWDQSTRTMQVTNAIPLGAWSSSQNGIVYENDTIWDIENQKPFRLPPSDRGVRFVACNRNRSLLFVLRDNGDVDVLRVTDHRKAVPILRLASPKKQALTAEMVISADDRRLFWQGWTYSSPVANKTNTVIAVFDIADLVH